MILFEKNYNKIWKTITRKIIISINKKTKLIKTHTTTDLPIIDKGPAKDIILSVMLTLAIPSSPASTLPRSPTCLKVRKIAKF